MRLVAIHVWNFKLLRDETIPLDDVTVVLGANSSGKSTIVDALRFMLGAGTRDSLLDLYDLPSHRRFRPDGPDPEFNDVVSVLGEYGDLTTAELRQHGALVHNGVLRVGGYLTVTETQEPKYRPACWVVPEADAPKLEPGSEDWIGLDPVEKPLIHRGFAWITRERLGYHIDFGNLLDPERPFERPFIGPGLNSKLPHVAWIPGPDTSPPDVMTLLQPIIRRRVERTIHDLPPRVAEALAGLVNQVEYDISDRLSERIAAVVPQAVSAVITSEWPRPGSDLLEEMVVRALLELDLYVRLPAPAGEVWDPEKSVRPPGSVPAQELGTGARRSLALAALSLYSDAELWPPDEPVLLLLEEPEAGLHPSAQRVVAEHIRQLGQRSGVQVVVVTHSPVFVKAAPLSSLRVTRADHADLDGAVAHVSRPEGLQRVASEVGADPTDVLLSDRFLVVEGPSDAAIVGRWCQLLAIDLGGVTIIDAEGWSKAELITQLLRLAFPTARISVLLDGDRATSGAADKIVARFKGRVLAHRLRRGAIEEYLPDVAVGAWLGTDVDASAGAEAVDSEQTKPAVSRLEALAQLHLGRHFDKRRDGVAIAEAMNEGDVAAEVKDFLYTALT